MRAFRIADRRHAIFDGTGARLYGGRWNSPGRPVIYAAETFAGALLEALVHANVGKVPRRHAVIDIVIPDSLEVETVEPRSLPGWRAESQLVCRRFGDRWLNESRSCVLLVPSAVTDGHERNVLINPLHPDFAQITASKPKAIRWDQRLFLPSTNCSFSRKRRSDEVRVSDLPGISKGQPSGALRASSRAPRSPTTRSRMPAAQKAQ
jgi:RES domain-containing protein